MPSINTNYSSYNTGLYGMMSMYTQSASKTSTMNYLKTSDIMSRYSVGVLGNAFNSDLASLTALKATTTSFKNAVDNLTKSSGTAFSKSAVISGNEKALTATLNSKIFKPYMPKPGEVKIDQIALAQKNVGTSMASAGKSITAGGYSFEIDIGGKSKAFNINVSQNDTNDTIQKKMALAINNANIGVTASVSTNAKDKTGQLVITAKETGTADGRDVFSIRDINVGDGKQGLVSTFGANNIDTKAQNAIYSVDGGTSKTSRSNDITLDNGVSIKLKEASDGAIKLSYQKDTKAAVEGVTSFIESFNSLNEIANDSGNAKLLTALNGISKSYASSLSSVGIYSDTKGNLVANSDKLEESAKNGKLENLFKDGGYGGFSNRLGNTARMISANPMQYAGSSAFSLYGNSQSSFMSTYSALFSGQLFNYMV